jgi:hypothetical protein
VHQVLWDQIKLEVKLLKCWNRHSVIHAWAAAELLIGLNISRIAELRLLTMMDQVIQAQQQPPKKWNRYGRLSTRIAVPHMICVQRLELVMYLVYALRIDWIGLVNNVVFKNTQKIALVQN